MFRSSRRTATRVKDGQVQKKNNWKATPTYWNTEQLNVVIDREAAGRGYRHLLRKDDVRRFIALLPDWKELSVGLNAILLARGNRGLDGWQDQGVVGLCAWERELWREADADYLADHADLFERLGVPRTGGRLEFTESSARAYQLLHILLHELGHHRDDMTTRSRRGSRGEGFAEQYALQYEKVIWNRFLDEFGLE
ncbi:MAG: hypothetical protein QM765_07250 [Myxococcales bacterium]